MKLKDVLLTTSMYLGREDVICYLQNPNDTLDNNNTLSLVDSLTRCANLVINELATTYLPLVKEEQMMAQNGKIRYDELSERATEIVEIVDEYGNKVNFKVFAEYVEVYKTKLTVKYKYIPSNLDLNDDVGYEETKVPIRVLAYATASEFCLIEKGYQESLMWRNRFCESLSNLITPKNYKIKERRFLWKFHH